MSVSLCYRGSLRLGVRRSATTATSWASTTTSSRSYTFLTTCQQSRQCKSQSLADFAIPHGSFSVLGSSGWYSRARDGPLSLPNRRTNVSSALSSSLDEDDTGSEPQQQTAREPFALYRQPGIRNIAVIAHIDHGKTTLVDQLIRATSSSSSESWLDSGELEAERGITITSKVTRLEYEAAGQERVIVNCVDTPGHADFLGASDPILSMVDGVLLLVDAVEGPMTQTKYVLSRALALGKKPLVVLNKCDRSFALQKVESGETEMKILDLFDALGASDEQMDYTTLYASAREGWVTDDAAKALELANQKDDEDNGSVDRSSYGMEFLLNTIIDLIPEPEVRSYQPDGVTEQNRSVEQDATANSPVVFENDKFSLAASTVGYDSYLGRMCTGRILSGSVRVGDEVTYLRYQDPTGKDHNDNGDKTQATVANPVGSISEIFVHEGVRRKPLAEKIAYAGDIVTLAGVPDSTSIGDTLTGSANPVHEPLETPPRAHPTLAVDFGANDGPLAGKEGSLLTSSKIRTRLYAEMDNNIGLSVENSTSDSEKTVVSARGELQLGILIEEMRREGFELIISPPRILTKTCPETGAELEPYEEVTVDVDSEYTGTVITALTGDRKGTLMEILDEFSGEGKSRLVFEIPSRALLGFNSEIATATKGSAVVTHMFLEDRPHAGQLGIALEKGKMVSNCNGKATAFALASLAARGELFVAPGDEVFSGMVIGECAKTGSPDMEVNPVRAKEKTNMRTHAKDEKVYLAPPKKRRVEELIGYMNEDEVIEVTPKNVRLRKLHCDASARELASRNKTKALRAAKRK